MATIDELSVLVSAVNRASGELQRVARDVTKLDQAAGKGTGFNRFNANSAKLSSVLSATGLQATSAGQGLYQMETATASLGLAAGATAVGVGALALGIGASIKAAVDFESAFADIKKTVDLTDEGFRQLEAGIRNMAKELPIAVTQLTSIGAIAGQLGITGAANIEKFIRTIAELGITTGLSADQLATSFGTLVSVLKTPINEVDRLGSALTALGNNFNSTEGEILDFSVRFAGAASVMKIGVADVAGISNAFASVGVEAERGGTAVQRVLLEIQQAAVNGGDKLRLFAAVTGTTIDQFKQLVSTDPTEVFVRFVEGLAAAGDQAIPVLDALGVADARLTASFLSAASAGDLLRDSINTSREAALQNTATQEEVAKRLDTTSAQFQILKNNVNDVAISIGQVFNPALKDTLKTVNAAFDGIDELAEAFDALNGPTKTAAVSISAMGTPLGLLGSAVAALGLHWETTWNAIASVLEPVVNTIIQAITIVINVFGGLLVELGNLAGGWSNIWHTIEGVIASVARTIKDILQGIVNAIVAAANFIDSFIGKVNGIAGKAGGLLGKVGIDVPNLPTLGLEAPQINIPRAGGNTVRSGNPAFDEQRDFQRDLRESAKKAGEAAHTASIDMGELDAALANLGGGGGGGGTASKATSEIESLAGAFEDWKLLNPGGTMEEFVARMELAQEGLLGVASSSSKVAEEAFRQRVELTKLALLFPGLTGAEVQFRIALGQIAEHLRETGETIQQFILDTSTSALEGFKSAFDEIFRRPTKETAALELQLATLERDKLLRRQAGASDEELKPLDAKIEALQLQLDIRRKEIDIIKAKNTLADQTLLTDAALATQAALLTEAIKITSAQVSEVGGIVYLQLTNLGNAANDAAAALRGITPQGFASGGFARGLAIVGERGPELADFGNGARIYSNRDTQALLNGASGGSYNTNIYITADSEASDAAMRRLARIVVNEQEQAIRRRGFAGANVSMNAFPPRSR